MRAMTARDYEDQEAGVVGTYAPADGATRGCLVLTGTGGEIWPSGPMAEAIVARRQAHGLGTQHLHLPDAGHACIEPPDGSGSPTPAWDAVVAFLRAPLPPPAADNSVA